MYSSNLVYNTERKSLVLPEYGRNIHDMANHLLTIADSDTRNKAALALIDIMGQLNPQFRDVEEYTHKLWDHLHIMTEFQLDVDSPYPKPSPEKFEKHPEPIKYSEGARYKYRHYGETIPKFIEHAKQVSDEKEKQALTQAIANMMKKAYLNWNRDSVEDELILEQLKELSENKLSPASDFELDSKTELIGRSSSNSNNNRRKGKGKRKNTRYKKKN